MIFGKHTGLPRPGITLNAALLPAVRRPGSMDAFTKPSLLLGQLKYPNRSFTNEEREGLSDTGNAGQHPA